MTKYSTPAPTLRDVLVALPKAPRPSSLALSILPHPSNPQQVYCSVEWLLNGPGGVSVLLKRWGQSASANSPTGHLSALLLAAHDAWAWFEGKDADELAAFAAWQMAAALSGGGALN